MLGQIADDLPAEVVQTALGHLDDASAIEVSDAEDRLASAAEHLVDALEAGGRRYRRLQRDLAETSTKAEQDQLTGLHNRHYLERFLGSQTTPAALLVMLVDVDDLKTVNDTCGHAAGDAVLTAVARVLRGVSRDGDVVVRWGGDEFMACSLTRDRVRRSTCCGSGSGSPPRCRRLIRRASGRTWTCPCPWV